MTTRREYAERIADAWNGAREAVFEAGRELLSAKAELPHGQFGAMIEHDLPFGPRHAQRLMAIAADPRLTNATHASLLPTAPTTLYELSRLDDATFAAAIEAKAINPEMERKDASRLRAAPRRAARLGAIESKAARCVPLSELGREGRRYAVILADPAWTHDVRSDKGKEKSPENHYPVMTTEDIMALPVRALAADDCVLFLWTTAPHDCRGDSRAVIKAWGFDTVVSQFVWRKTNGDGTPHRGTGYWNQSCHEIVLIATKGKVAAPLQQDLPLSVIDAPVAAHSEKPAVFRALIERYFPDVVRLEMNARLTPERCAEIGGSGLNDGRAGFFMGDDGWHYWGNEVDPGALAAAPPTVVMVGGEPVDAETGEILPTEGAPEGAARTAPPASAEPESHRDEPARAGAADSQGAAPDPALDGDDPMDIPAFLRRPKSEAAA